MEDEIEAIPFLRFRIKKSKRADFVDALIIIKESTFTEDEHFYYVQYEEENLDRNVKILFNNVWGLKATKLWINGREVYQEDYKQWTIDNTLFCVFKENCEGICLHTIEFGRWTEISADDPHYNEKIAQTCSIIGFENWIKNNKETIIPNYVNEYILDDMSKYSIMNFKKEESLVELDKKIFQKYVVKKLKFEIDFCPIISREKTLNVIDGFPEKLTLSSEMVKYFEHKYERPLGILSREIAEERDVEAEEINYEKLLAEYIGEEMERRFRKVLSEFFEKK